jgi:hypothetical protein
MGVKSEQKRYNILFSVHTEGVHVCIYYYEVTYLSNCPYPGILGKAESRKSPLISVVFYSSLTTIFTFVTTPKLLFINAEIVWN